MELLTLSISEDKVEFFTFDLYNFREQIKRAVKDSRGDFPRDIELKSYNDMLQSIVASLIRSNPYNWIFCEGLSDKIYLDFYLGDLIENLNLRIVPLGGFKEVRRAFNYLQIPLDDPEYKISGKVLCLVDTDAQLEHVGVNQKIQSISFKRIIYDAGLDLVKLIDVDDQLVSPATEIEFSLCGARFIEAVELISLGDSNHPLKRIIDKADLKLNSPSSYGYLNLTPTANVQIMKEFFDVGDGKVEFAKAYTSIDSKINEIPKWILQITEFFTPKLKKFRGRN